MNYRVKFDPNNDQAGGLSLVDFYLVEKFTGAANEIPLKGGQPSAAMLANGDVYRIHHQDGFIDTNELGDSNSPLFNTNYNQRWCEEGSTTPKEYHKWNPATGDTCGVVYMAYRPFMVTVKVYQGGYQPGQTVNGYTIPDSFIGAYSNGVEPIDIWPTNPNPNEVPYLYLSKYPNNIQVLVGWNDAGTDCKPHWFNTGGNS